MASPISTDARSHPFTRTEEVVAPPNPQQILKDNSVRVIQKGQPIPGQKDTYLMKTDITRVEAEEILRQTGLEIAFAPGERVRTDFMLGAGGFGTLRVGYATKKAHYVGIKITQGNEAAKAEVMIQNKLSHLPYIMPSIDYCLAIDSATGSVLYQVMPLAGLGSVAKISPAITVLDDPVFKEQIFFVLTQAILKGLLSMHQEKCYHLDIKPDNLVVNQKGDIFLIDFGCSLKKDNGLIDAQEQIGDWDFFSPERLLAQQAFERVNPWCRGDKIDIWAAGLTLLSVATNTPQPQPDKVEARALLDEVYRKFPALQNSKPNSFWGFIKFLLVHDPNLRPTAAEAMNHPWYKEREVTESLWKRVTLDHLCEMVQALQRERRNLPVENHQGKYRKSNPTSAAPKVASSLGTFSPQDLPLPHFADFIERQSLQQAFLGRLKFDLIGKPSSVLPCAGLGGSGKSQLVTYLLHKVKGQYGLTLYFRSSDQRVSLETQHLVLARELGLIDNKASVEKAVAALHQYFANLSQPSLIVYDNADDPEVLQSFAPPFGAQIILTTRNPAWNEPFEVGSFIPEEGKELVEKLLQREEPHANLLCEELGYLPLGVVQACAYIRNQRLTVKSYIEKLQITPQMLQEDQKLFGKRLSNSMGALWKITFDTLKREAPQALKLLDTLAYLSPDGIPSTVLDALDKTNSREMLLRYALLQGDPSQTTYFIHRLLQRVVRTEKNVLPLQQSLTSGVLNRLNRVLHRVVATPENRLFRQQEILDSVMLILQTIYTYNPKTPKERKTNHQLVYQGDSLLSHYDKLLPAVNSESLAKTLLWVAEGHRDQGNPKRTVEVLEKAVLVVKAIYGNDHPQVATNLNNLGTSCETLGEARKAVEYHERALAIWEKTYGKDHPTVAKSLSNLGNAWKDLGDSKKAIECHEKALAIKEKILGRGHPSVAISLNNLGAAWDSLRETKRAVEYYERALIIDEKTYGKDHPQVGISLNNLGTAWGTLGDNRRAIEYHERALAIREKIYGKDHPSVATSLNNLGGTCYARGETKKAIDYYERALAIREKTYGKDHIHIAVSLNHLGLAWDAFGDAKKAIEYHERALVIKEKAYSRDHPEVAISLSNLGSAWSTLKETKKAIDYYERALAILEKTYVNAHPDVATSLSNLGNAWKTLGDSKKAIEYYERALVIKEKAYSKDHLEVAISLSNLGSAWKTLGDSKKAIPYYERALAILEKIYGNAHPDVAISLSNLGNAWKTLGDSKRTIEYCERALASDTKRHPNGHPSVVRDLATLATACLGNQEKAKGFKLLEQALGVARKIPGWTDSHPRVIEILQLIEQFSK